MDVISFLIRAVGFIVQVLVIAVLADVILSYFMSPFHPVKMFLDRIVSPMLTPIRRVVPSLGGLDFSPLVLIVLLQLIGGILVNLLVRLR